MVENPSFAIRELRAQLVAKAIPLIREYCGFLYNSAVEVNGQTGLPKRSWKTQLMHLSCSGKDHEISVADAN